jgi:hypothetical protein
VRSGDLWLVIGSLQLPTVDGHEDWDAETLGDALDVLQDLVLWELVPQRWEQVEQLLDRMQVAIASRDAGDLRDAVADLELSGPVRVSLIGSTPIRGIPEPVLERRNSLVHALTLEQARRSATTEAGSGDKPAR